MDRSASSEHLLDQHLSALEQNMPEAMKGNADALHQARVASRRVRALLPLVSSGARGKKLERRVRKLTRALGPVRDLDVALQILADMQAGDGASPSAVAALRDGVEHDRQVMRAEMQRRVERVDLDKLRKRAARALRHKRDDRTPRRDPSRLADARRRTGRRAEWLRGAIESAAGLYLPDRLHMVRIAAKKLRYSMELVADLSGSRASGQLRTLKETQDLLGRMHDLELLIGRARSVQAAPGAVSLQLSGDLDQLVRRFETECRQLHAHYMGGRHALVAICEQAIDGMNGKRAAA